MTNEQLNAMLYEKVAEEQKNFKGWLVKQKPEDILDHAYEYASRESIVMELENIDLPSAQAKSLLALPDTLGVLYKDFRKLDAVEPDAILGCIERRAEAEEKRGSEQRPSIRQQLKEAVSEQARKTVPRSQEQER